ncbi:MAG TPA: GNAT family N-acetyltransferase [Terriglobales bacterium]|nr:GNAT family N-acetyltransferase [Terriglobales bacterium]
MSTIEKIRRLSVADIPAGLELSALAGWNQTAEDWRMLLWLAPEGCFGMEVNGRVVGTATLICYGKELGWIGMVLTHPEFRGRGFAKRLFEHVLQRADVAGICTLKLDATDHGKPLYEKYGFRSEQTVERWGGKLSEVGVTGCERFTKHGELDMEAFGADRSELLRMLAVRGNCISSDAGFLMTRPGTIASYLGPCAARDQESAMDLFHVVLQRGVGDIVGSGGLTDTQTREWYWDLLPKNESAVELALKLGFTPRRKLTRMFRGQELRARDEFVYAIAGFEMG